MKLIVNADDFGFTKGVNKGIIKAHKKGTVTSCTAMVTMPAIYHAKKLAKKYPTLKIGLHLNITLGKPLTNCPTLTKDNGMFYKPKENPDISKFKKEEIKQELLAQYNLFITIFGRKPTHLDSHLYAHQIYDVVSEIVYEFAKEKGIPVRDLATNKYRKADFINWFKILEGESIADIWQRLETNKELLLSLDIVELMVHPAFPDKYLFNNSSYNKQRKIELEILISKKFKNFIKDNQIELTNYEEGLLCLK